MSTPPIPSAYRFPDEPDAVEFRSFTHGLQPERVPHMMEQFTEDWRQRGVDAWNEVPNHWRPDADETVGWWTLPTYLGDEFVAPLLGAPPETCILQPSVHWTVQCLLSSPEVAARGTDVVVPETAFPSVLHSVQRWSDLRDLTPHVVAPTGDHRVDRSALLDAIGPDTALVALSHVGFTTGACLPDSFLQSVAERARRHDALFLLDGYHAAATRPIDVTQLGCDLYVGGLLKEASGSAGNTFLYLRDGLELAPRLTGWFGNAAPFEFRTEPSPHPDVRRRFLGGTTPVAPMYHAVEGVRLLLDVGLEAVRDHSLALTDRAIERADALDIPLRSPRAPTERSAMVLLEVPEAERLAAHLKQQHVYTDSRRNEVLRMAPFVWNTREEVDHAFNLIGDALDTGAYRSRSVDAAGPVT
ncbi:aminotransferase class V-fold PLP-dependent enzyme [Salinibacter ruber]|uniref:aminotransferase class V-fold PLP-dependent enzyme n=1 Tax=Salinibacter ruber TaxID=146919 RepID=UPI0020737991|nr:aminotransferase class V-fold PLP-dependent enzyme [Salinibacter ruber]MCS3627340.1 kynureninase [Salinibacter ruber]MCS3825461.1 kynureninase [Salinibacter ruber]MCS3938356.1 kynureninase [Salinibacter ruber]MCS4050623.1 kynureninase [Salinibacter ruber]MCS4144333.1 kynureninase [Salinibacter ruber]